MRTSKAPKRVFLTASRAATRALPAHRHRFVATKFYQPQYLACLVLNEFLRLDYRGLAAHLAEHTQQAHSVGLRAVTHYTTFHLAARRLLAARPGRRMFDAVLEYACEDGVRRRRVRLAGSDGTGLESRHISRYSSGVTVHGACSAHEADRSAHGWRSEGVGCDRMLASKHEVRKSSTERPR